jgi:hypothetical protein
MGDDLPRLGPRVWWVYLAVDTPKTVDQLAADAGIVPDSIRAHLRRLERAGLVRVSEEPGAEPMWLQARELDPGAAPPDGEPGSGPHREVGGGDQQDEAEGRRDREVARPGGAVCAGRGRPLVGRHRLGRAVLVGQLGGPHGISFSEMFT